MKKHLILFFILFGHIAIFGFNGDNPVFKKMSLKQGLPHSNIYELFQDKKGFIWIGTEHGLCRYDGYDFLYYFHNPTDKNSLSESDVSCLAQAEEKKLWIGTWGGGLNSLNLQTGEITRFVHDSHDINSISGNRVKKIIIDKKGRYWISTFNNGINMFDPVSGKFKQFKNDKNDKKSISDNRIWDIVEGSNDVFWIGTRKGLCKFDFGNKEFKDIVPQDIKIKKMLSSRIRRLKYSDNETIWILTQKGICNFNPSTNTFSTTKLMEILNEKKYVFNNILLEKNGNCWLATNGGGLIFFSNTDKIIREFKHNIMNPYSISSNDVRNFLKDRSGNLWIGTRGGGINIISINTSKFNVLRKSPFTKNSLSSKRVGGIVQCNNGNILIACSYGLNIYNKKKGTVDFYYNDEKNKFSLSNNAVSTVLKTQKGACWVGTLGGGLNNFNPKTGKFIHFTEDSSLLPSNSVTALFEDSKQTLWIGTTGGLSYYNSKTNRLSNYGVSDNPKKTLSNKIVRAICEDNDGNIWIGTEFGLDVLNKKTGELVKYFHEVDNNSISSNVIHALFKDSKGNIWIGTSSGLSIFDRVTKKFIIPLKNIFLKSNIILSFLEDNNNNTIWIGTHNGLFAFNPFTKELLMLNENDGLPSGGFSENACFKSKDGELFFGTSDGLISFFPESIKTNKYVPEIVLTSCKVMNSDVINDYDACFIKEIELDFKHRGVELEFAALDYTNSQKQQYNFKLEGMGKVWESSSAKRTVSYFHLPAGSYTLKVQAANSDGKWNREGISLKIKVIPPIWKALWFKIMCILGFFSFIAIMYYVRISRIKKQKHELEVKIKEAMENIKTLSGFIPICASCKKIRDDKGYWNQLEEYISEHSDAIFSHGICPECKKEMYKELDEYKK